MTSGIPSAASVTPARTSAGTRDRSTGAIPCRKALIVRVSVWCRHDMIPERDAACRYSPSGSLHGSSRKRRKGSSSESEGAPHEPRGMERESGSTGSGRDPRRAGSVAGAGSGTDPPRAGCWSRRSRSIEAAPRSWLPISRTHRRLESRCSAAATHTWPTSEDSSRQSVRWSSTSTTSTRRCPARGSGTSRRLTASLVVAARDRGFDDEVARRTVADAVRTYRTAMREFAGQRNLDVWYARLDIQSLLESLAFRHVEGDRGAASGQPAEGAGEEQSEGVRQADRTGRRDGADQERSPAGRALRRVPVSRSGCGLREHGATLDPGVQPEPGAGASPGARRLSASSTSPARSSASAASVRDAGSG